MYSILLYIPSAKARPAARGRADFIFESTNCQAIQHKGGMVSVMCSLGEGLCNQHHQPSKAHILLPCPLQLYEMNYLHHL